MAQLLERRVTLYKPPDFRRVVGSLGLTSVSLGTIIGSGWLLAPLAAANAAGGASLLSWMLGGVIIMLLALVHSELGAAYPVAGGTARWPRLAFGSLSGFTAGWVSWLGGVTLSPLEVEAAIGYLSHSWHGLIDPSGVLTRWGFGLGTVLMLLFTVINILGVRWLTRSNTIIVLWKIGVPLLTVIVLIWASFHPSNFVTGGGFASGGAHGIFAALSGGVIFAFQGFEEAVQFGSEARDPKRNLPRAVIWSVVVSFVLYLTLQAAFIGAFDPRQLINGWTNVDKGEFAPFVALASVLGLAWLAQTLRVDAVISPASTGLVFVGISGRLGFALGHANYVPRQVSRISSRGVPRNSIIVAFFVGVFFLPFTSWADLVKIVTCATVLMYAFAPITLLALRKSDPNRRRPYQLRAAPVLAPLAFIGANEIIYYSSWPTVGELMLAVVVGYALFMIYYVGRPPIERPPLDLWSLVWMVPWFGGLTAISYFGRYGDRATMVIPEWVDLGVVAAFSLVIFYVAVWFRLPGEEVVDAVEVDKFESIPKSISVASSGDHTFSLGDHIFIDGEVRQLPYGQSELAVVDASVEVVGVNWTAKIGPDLFFSEVSRLVGLDDNMVVTLSVSPDSAIQQITISNLRTRLVDANFCSACEFVRLDLSATQSVIWQRSTDGDLVMVGFGDHTATFTGDGEAIVRNLLAATATPAVDLDEVLLWLQKLVQQYAHTAVR